MPDPSDHHREPPAVVNKAKSPPVLELTSKSPSLRSWVGDMLAHREVLVALAAKDFKVRYKRATFGVLWAVALPIVQAAIMVTVFSRLGLDDERVDYIGYVLAGITAWSFASLSITAASGSVVEGAGLTDKVWFPRALLPLSNILANLIGLGIGTGLVACLQLVRGQLDAGVFLAVPGATLLIALVTGISLVTSALYVWFRDLRFMIQAGMLVLFYATPVLYLPDRLGNLADFMPLNPFAGTVSLYQRAFAGNEVDQAAVASACAYAMVLLILGSVLHARNDRRFVDLL